MAQTSTLTASARSLGQMLAAPFVGFAKIIEVLSEARPRMRQIELLSEKTDAQLAAVGKTRDGELRRIFGAQFYI
ncbi:MAG: hypothetical protein JWS10_2398 [Cypionkella sp.]|nr:hypothetical protein [Cypionkella sp.]MDB5659783.1 hypothetical protein [Cypionkella sp.]MDB5663517.1 hypothetical protein [Cypionkella sp.]